MPLSEDGKDRVEDVAGAVVEAALSMLPGIGGPLAVTFNRTVGSAVQRRQQQRLEELRTDLERYARDFHVEIATLSTNEEFLSTTLRAVRAMDETANERKRARLRAAILNSIDSSRWGDHLEEFAELVSRYDELTVAALYAVHGTTRGSVHYMQDAEGLRKHLKEHRGIDADSQRCTALLERLFSDGLLERSRESELANEPERDKDGRLTDLESLEVDIRDSYRLTVIGRQFLSFIRSPVATKEGQPST